VDVISSNSIQTSNIIATGNVVIGQGVTAIQANVHFEQSNVFIGNSAAVGTIYNTLPSSIIKFDNSVISTISGAATASAANRILLHSNTTAAQNFSGIGVLVGAPTNYSQLNLFGGTISLYAGGNQYLFMTSGNGTGFGTNNPKAGIHITTVPTTSNTGLRVDSSNIALATTGGGLVGIGTTTPQANLHVVGNVFIGQNLTTIQANVHIEQSNVFIGNSAIVNNQFSTTGPTNQIIFDNTGTELSGGKPNKITLFSNISAGIYAGIGISSVSSNFVNLTLSAYGHTYVTNGAGYTTAAFTNSGTFSVGGFNAGARLYVTSAGATGIGARIDTAGTAVALTTMGGGTVGFGTTQPTANLQVVGNIYASTDVVSSNSIQTSNIIATGNVVIGQGVTAIQANIHFEQSNVFIGNSAAIGSTVNTTLQPSILKFDNSVGSVATFPNKILLYSNTTTPATNDYVGLGVWTASAGNQTRGLSLYGRAGLNFYTGSAAVNSFTILSSGFVGVGVSNPTCTLQVNGSTVALATTGGGTVGFGTTQPTANLQVVGNIYASTDVVSSNSVQTSNIIATGNVVIGQGVTAIQSNLHVEKSNVFIGNSACVGTTVSTTNPLYSLNFDNSTAVPASGNITFPNKIILYNQSGTNNYCGIGVQGGIPSTIYYGRGGHIFMQQSTQVLQMNAGGTLFTYPVAIGSTTAQQTGYCLQLIARGGPTNNYTTNVALRIESSNICMTTGASYAGFGTTQPTANLHVVGNVYASGTISYSYDLVQQGAYLNPTTANSSTIIQWYQRLVTTTGQPFWSLNASPQFGALTPIALTGFNSTTLLNDGRVLFNQIGVGNNIGFFTPERNQFSVVSGGFTIVSYDYTGAIQIPDGRVIFIPSNQQRVGALNPITYAFTTYSTGTSGVNNAHQGAVYEPSGNVIMTPSGTSSVGIFNTATNSYSRVSFATDATGYIYFGSVLLTDGRVLFVPNTTSNIGIYTPTTATYTNVTVTVSGSYAGGCLMTTGNVFMAPFTNSSNAIIYNPFLNTQSNVNGLNGTVIGGAGGAGGCASLPDGRIVIFPGHNNSGGSIVIYNSVTGAFNQVSGTSSSTYQNSTFMGGGTLIPDGRIIFAGNGTYGAYALDTRTPAPREFCLHPFFNKS
jgi:lipopolysaccharide export system protein LptA